MIACKTTIGFGAADQGRHQQGAWRGARRRRDRRRAQGAELALRAVRRAGRDPVAPGARPATRGAPKHEAWKNAFDALKPEQRAEFERRDERRRCRRTSTPAIDAYKQKLAADAPAIATRKAGEAALNVIAPAVPELVTGSADLTGSNNTKVAATPEITPTDFSGRYIHWGIREHGMAAACNGISRARRDHPLGRVLPVLHRLLPAGAAHRRAVRTFVSCMSSRMIPSASARTGRPISRSSIWRRFARHAEPLHLAPGRQRRDGRMLAGGAGKEALALDPGADPADAAGAAQDACGGRISARSGAYELYPADGKAAGLDLRLRLGGLASPSTRRRSSRRRASRPASSPCPAWTLFLDQPEELSPVGDRRRAGQGRRRGGGAAGLGCADRRWRRSSA